MGVHRLWWVPEGTPAHDGCYVRYPREEILAVIAAEAAASSTTIVGENLGTVPEEVFEALARWDVLGLYEEQFHVHAHELPAVPARAIAGVRTHDMPAFAAVAGAFELGHYRWLLSQWLGRDVDGVPGRSARRRPRAARPQRRLRRWSPTSTTCSARRRRTTCPATCSTPRGGAACRQPTSEVLADPDVVQPAAYRSPTGRRRS